MRSVDAPALRYINEKKLQEIPILSRIALVYRGPAKAISKILTDRDVVKPQDYPDDHRARSPLTQVSWDRNDATEWEDSNTICQEADYVWNADPPRGTRQFSKLTKNADPFEGNDAGRVITRKLLDKLVKRLQTAIPDAKVLVGGVSGLPERMRAQITKALRGGGNDAAEFAKRLQGVSDTFDSEIQRLIDGTLPEGHIFKLGNAGAILQAAGIPNQPIELASRRLTDKSIQAEHPFGLGEAKGLVKAIQDPIAVFESTTVPGRKVIFTELEHTEKGKTKNFIAAVEINKAKHGRLAVTDIRSLYPRNNRKIVVAANNPNARAYFDKARMLDWLDKQQSNSAEVAQLAKKGINISQEIADAKKNVEKFQNPISDADAENVQFHIAGFHGSPHVYNQEILVEHPDGSREYIEGKRVGVENGLPKVPEGAKLVKEFPNGRFRSDKIGTGEGNLAYGYGHYLATLEDVADWYKDEFLDWDKPLSEQGEKVKKALAEDYETNDLGTQFLDVSGKDIYNASVESQRKLHDYRSRHETGIRYDQAASKYLLSLGIRGIKYLDGSSRGNGEGSHNYVVFDDADIEVTGVELMRSPSTSKRTASPIGFYSRADRTLTNKLPNKAAPGQILALLNPQKGSGIKELDPEYQALKLWLDDQKGTLAKADVLDFVRGNKVEVENVVLGDPVPQSLHFDEVDIDTSILSLSRTSGYDADSDTITDQWESDGYTILRDHNDRYFAFDEQSNEIEPSGNSGYFSNFQSAVEAVNEQAAIDRSSVTPFSQFTLPGDHANYREEFLTAPVDPRFGENGEIYNVEHEWNDGHGGYSNIQNPIVRLRYDDRETADGELMLFNEEAQQPSKDNLAKMPKVYQKYGEEMGWRRMIYKAVNEGYDYLGFTTGEQQADRYNLAKVVDSIAIRPGILAGEKRIEIETPHQANPITFTVGEDGVVMTGGSEGFYNKHLSEVVGKDIAKQILESTEPLTIEGEGLRIGGQALANRYDKKAVDYLNKFLKPYGGKVELVSLGEDRYRDVQVSILSDGTYEVEAEGDTWLFETEAEADAKEAELKNTNGTTKVHAVKITPAMREAFGQDKGVPLLMQNRDLLGATFPDGTVWLNENHLNANTPIHEFGHLWSKMFPERWNDGMDFIRETPAGRKLMDSLRELYGDNEQTLANEALAHAVGKQGEGIFTGSLLTRFKNWLKDLYRRIAGKFGRTVSDSDGIDDLARKIASELLGGRELKPNQVAPQGTMLFSKLGRDADPFEGNDREREEVGRQMVEVKEVRDDKGRLLAPNGEVSQLPEHLWKAVRTPFFRRYAGEWELMQKQTPVHSISRHSFSDLKDAEVYAVKHVLGEYQNSETGNIIQVSKRSIDKFLSPSSTQKSSSLGYHLATLRAIPNLINDSILAEEHPDNGKRKEFTMQRYYGAVQIGDDLRRVKLTVRAYLSGSKRNYTYEVSDIETLGGSLSESTDDPKALSRTPSVSMATLLQGARKNNGDLWDTTYTKVLDENGEPMVVYHGTGADFDSFDFQRTPDAKLSSGKGAYLTTSPKAAGLYSLGISWGNAGGIEGQPSIVPAFVSIRKPFDKNADYRLSDLVNIPELDDKRREIERENAPSVESYYDDIDQLQDFLHDLETGDPVDLVDRYGAEIGRIYEEDYEQGREDEDYIRDAGELVQDEIERTAKAISRNEKQIEAAYADSREAIRKATLKGYQIWDSIKEALPAWKDYQNERNLFGGDIDAFEFDTEVAEILNDVY